MFLSTLLQSLFKMLVLAAAAVAGIIAGKKVRDRKDAKTKEEA